MYNFLANLWRLGRLSEAQLEKAELAGRITAEEAEEIRALPKA